MREILFRGKTDKGKWVQGQLLRFKSSVGTGELAVIVEGCEWDNSNKWFNLGKRAKVIPETVGQYTGLTDKNGTKIFEGDIVRGMMDFGPAGYYPQIVSVLWDDMNGYQWNYFLLDTIEVIGNIHDNPELLKEREG